MMGKVLLSIVITLMAAGCSNRAVYENLQQHQKNKCLEDSPANHQQCIFNPQKSYDEYKKEREQHLEQTKGW